MIIWIHWCEVEEMKDTIMSICNSFYTSKMGKVIDKVKEILKSRMYWKVRTPSAHENPGGLAPKIAVLWIDIEVLR